MPIHESELYSKPKKRSDTEPFWFRAKDDVAVCGARTRKGNGWRCSKDWALSPTSGRCRMHGGHPNAGAPYKSGGRYSEKLKRLKDEYIRHMGRGDILDVREDIVLMDTGIGELLELAEAKDTRGLREKAARICDRALSECDDEAGLRKALAEVSDLLNEGVTTAMALEAALSWSDRRANRAQREREILIKADQVTTRAGVVQLLLAITDVILDKAPPDIAKRIIDDLHRLSLIPGYAAGEGENGGGGKGGDMDGVSG